MSSRKIAYLTMAYDVAKTDYMAIPNCVDQTGNYDKVLYIMYQEPFPPHIGKNHDLPIEIKEYNVEGIKGYGWWLMKLNKFLEVCTETHMVWWDEDDYRLNDYTKKALSALTQYSPIAWNLWNYEVKRGSILKKQYTSGMGTLVAVTDFLRIPAAALTAKYPDGRLRIDETRRPVDCNYTGKWTYASGALDAYLKKQLKLKYKVAEHEGVRFMTFHSKTNTHGGRKPEENVDYGC